MTLRLGERRVIDVHLLRTGKRAQWHEVDASLVVDVPAVGDFELVAVDLE